MSITSAKIPFGRELVLLNFRFPCRLEFADHLKIKRDLSETCSVQEESVYDREWILLKCDYRGR